MQSIDNYKLSYKEYKSIFRELYESLCLFANKYVEDIEVSKDIVQDVFIKIWEDNITFNNKNNIKSFLYTAVKNRSLDYLKSKRYRVTEGISEIDLEKMDTESFFLREVVIIEASKIIEKAINTLPNKCAEIIRLSVKNLSNSEIAEELDISLNTVKAQKQIAYKRLKPLLKDYFVLIAFIFRQDF